MSSFHNPMSRTADQWRAQAQDCRRRSAESFARCDTDGFMSQGAADSMARIYDECARVAENDGMADFPALADADGNLIEGARLVETRYGWSWVYDTEAGAVWFRESAHSNPDTAKARDLAKGYQVVYVARRALVGFGRGSFGMAPVITVPARDQDI